MAELRARFFLFSYDHAKKTCASRPNASQFYWVFFLLNREKQNKSDGLDYSTDCVHVFNVLIQWKRINLTYSRVIRLFFFFCFLNTDLVAPSASLFFMTIN